MTFHASLSLSLVLLWATFFSRSFPQLRFPSIIPVIVCVKVFLFSSRGKKRLPGVYVLCLWVILWLLLKVKYFKYKTSMSIFRNPRGEKYRSIYIATLDEFKWVKTKYLSTTAIFCICLIFTHYVLVWAFLPFLKLIILLLSFLICVNFHFVISFRCW